MALVKPCGLWIHEDDLSLERSECAGLAPSSIQAFLPRAEWSQLGFPERKQEQWGRAMADAAQRAGEHFEVQAGVSRVTELAGGIAAWAAREQLACVVAVQPFVGPLVDQLGKIRAKLAECGCRLQLFRRSEDRQLMCHATAGFFGFWKKCRRTGLFSGPGACN